MKKPKLMIIYIIAPFLVTLSNSCFSMLCPTNFNTINIGDSMDKIIQLCGAPDSQYQYTDTVSLSGGSGVNQSSGYYYQTQNQYSTSGSSNYVQQNEVKQRQLTITKFFYKKTQPAVLIFVDGELQDRQLIPQ